MTCSFKCVCLGILEGLCPRSLKSPHKPIPKLQASMTLAIILRQRTFEALQERTYLILGLVCPTINTAHLG